MSKRTELNPCPVCKSTKVMVTDESFYAYHAKCFTCGLDLRESYQYRRYGSFKPSYEEKQELESMERARKTVIRRWNNGDIENPIKEPTPRYWAY